MTQQPLPEPAAPARADDSRVHELIDLTRRVWRLAGDRRVPLRYKVIPILAIAYMLSPIDLIPDSVPFLTQIDDLAVLLVAARLFVHLAEGRAGPADPAAVDDGGHTVTATYRVHED